MREIAETLLSQYKTTTVCNFDKQSNDSSTLRFRIIGGAGIVGGGGLETLVYINNRGVEYG